MPKNSSIDFLGYHVFNASLENILDRDKILVSTINQYSYCMAQSDAIFRDSLKSSDVLLPDGIGIVWAYKLLYGKKIKKIAGADLHEFLLRDTNEKNGACFYMGSSEDTLKKIEARIAEEFPNIRVGSYSPPFKKEFSAEENQEILRAVNDFKPDVLFVGMTAPKQEKWSMEHKTRLDASLICSIGAVFDFYAGTVERPSQIWINMGLEWLGRLIKEPKRMWKRYVNYGFVFVYYMFKEGIKKGLGMSVGK
ncbi:WecB/TagA/CpsF family glycosyltransferase [Maribacter sp. 2-571]|uniref:WecB/TagA/CpsF family glycosyltransferase n=1 Tax=Maribacter sp. 2-571 TaxID=3417569 RepID=UPI003D34F9B2